jgi:sugar lactone lactonase YvrE
MSARLLRPVRWRPPAAPDRARQSVSTPPMPPLRRLELDAPGPEDVVMDAAGRLLTGVDDGRILRVDPRTGAAETVADTGGRPLGLEVAPDGALLICDSRRGLLRADLDTGTVDVLVAEIDGVPLNFASNVVADDDGTIYFSASTRRFDLEHYLGDVLEHSSTGRLFRRTPAGEVETLLDGLDFANGVVLAPDRSCVIVAETAGYCLTRYWLTGPRAGSTDPLIENLPGMPDNTALGSDGLIWVSLPVARDRLLDRLLPLPGVLRQVAWLLPPALQPKPARTVWVIAVDFDGRIVHDLQTAGEHYSFVTSVWERDGRLYLGSLHEHAIALTTVPSG